MKRLRVRETPPFYFYAGRLFIVVFFFLIGGYSWYRRGTEVEFLFWGTLGVAFLAVFCIRFRVLLKRDSLYRRPPPIAAPRMLREALKGQDPSPVVGTIKKLVPPKSARGRITRRRGVCQIVDVDSLRDIGGYKDREMRWSHWGRRATTIPFAVVDSEGSELMISKDVFNDSVVDLERDERVVVYGAYPGAPPFPEDGKDLLGKRRSTWYLSESRAYETVIEEGATVIAYVREPPKGKPKRPVTFLFWGDMSALRAWADGMHRMRRVRDAWAVGSTIAAALLIALTVARWNERPSKKPVQEPPAPAVETEQEPGGW